MNNDNNPIEISDRFAAMWLAARTDAGMSQADAAKAIGVSKTTIQNWENGTSSPSQKQGFMYFNALGIQPLPYYLSVIYPNHFKDLSPESSDKEIEDALTRLIKGLPSDTKRKILYIAYGDHGSAPTAVLEMILTHLHTPLVSRIGVAELIRSNYELAESLGRVVGTNHIMPDKELLSKALERAKAAINVRAKHYTAVN